MQKALTQMNVQFHHVINDITGLTGLAILDAILAGERDPAVLAKLRDPHECDQEIEKLVAAFEPRVDPADKPMPEDRKQKQRTRKKKSGHPDFNMRAEPDKLFGVDLTQIPGLMTLVFLPFSEVGRDMPPWPTAGHFVSWLGLCPDNDISGGQGVVVRRPAGPRTAPGLCSDWRLTRLHRDQTPMGDYLRRMKAKLGPAAATTATAHKIAIIFYTMVKQAGGVRRLTPVQVRSDARTAA